jgi:hypothetical protein
MSQWKELSQYNPNRENLNTGKYTSPRVSRRRALRIGGTIAGAVLLFGAIDASQYIYNAWEYANPQSEGIQDGKVTFVNQFPTTAQDPLLGKIGLLNSISNPVIQQGETIFTPSRRVMTDVGIDPNQGQLIELDTTSYLGTVDTPSGVPRVVQVNELASILVASAQEAEQGTGRLVGGWQNNTHPRNLLSAFLLERNQANIPIVGFWTFGPIKNGVTGEFSDKFRFIATRFPTNRELAFPKY